MSEFPPEVYSLIDAAIAEDQTFNDPTTAAVVPSHIRGAGMLRAKAHGVLAGVDVGLAVFRRVEPALELEALLADGAALSPGDEIARVAGPAAGILRAERIAQLIYVSITPFGQSGPKSMWAASDLIGHVSGGLSSLVGDPDRAPLRPSVEQAYNITALNAGSAAMIALHARHLSGCGQHVDVSMQAAMANTLGNARLYYEMDGIITQRAGGARAFADRATRIIYPCADGYVAFVRVPASMIRLHHWMTAEGAEPQFDAERWASIAIAGDSLPTEAEVTELETEIEAFFAAHGAQALYESGQHFNVMICPVNTMQDIVDSPQLNAREFFEEVDDPALGQIKVPGAPLKMSATPWQTRPAPTVGQHNSEILTGSPST